MDKEMEEERQRKLEETKEKKDVHVRKSQIMTVGGSLKKGQSFKSRKHHGL